MFGTKIKISTEQATSYIHSILNLSSFSLYESWEKIFSRSETLYHSDMPYNKLYWKFSDQISTYAPVIAADMARRSKEEKTVELAEF